MERVVAKQRAIGRKNIYKPGRIGFDKSDIMFCALVYGVGRAWSAPVMC
jgi:hypothetical protein